mgnify:CR=1 FL=1
MAGGWGGGGGREGGGGGGGEGGRHVTKNREGSKATQKGRAQRGGASLKNGHSGDSSGGPTGECASFG